MPEAALTFNDDSTFVNDTMYYYKNMRFFSCIKTDNIVIESKHSTITLPNVSNTNNNG